MTSQKQCHYSSKHPFAIPQLSPGTDLLAPCYSLASSIPVLNETLEGGLRWGELCEWGCPWGCGGREVIIRFLCSLPSDYQQQTNWCLWVQGQDDVNIYPPAWEAQGVDLAYIRFTSSQNPVKDLKPVFLSSLFKIIILDCPQTLSAEDCQFLARQARQYRQIIILIRNYFLSPKKGNIWAKLRLNCWRQHLSEKFFIKVIKGLSPRQISFGLNLDPQKGLFS